MKSGNTVRDHGRCLIGNTKRQPFGQTLGELFIFFRGLIQILDGFRVDNQISAKRHMWNNTASRKLHMDVTIFVVPNARVQTRSFTRPTLRPCPYRSLITVRVDVMLFHHVRYGDTDMGTHLNLEAPTVM